MKKIVAGVFALCMMSCVASKINQIQWQLPESIYAAETLNLDVPDGVEAPYSWYVEDSLIGNNTSSEFVFTSSGRKQIRLVYSDTKGNRSVTRDIIVLAPKECHIVLQTSLGELILKLSELTPKHLKQISALVNEGYYDGISFHRVMDGFVCQVGDPRARKEAFDLKYDLIPKETVKGLYHHTGALAAARFPDNVNPEKKSSATQFYIVDQGAVSVSQLKNIAQVRGIEYSEEDIEKYLTNGGAPQLDGEYTVFGCLVYGWDILDAISQVPTDNRDKPIDPVWINKAFVIK